MRSWLSALAPLVLAAACGSSSAYDASPAPTNNHPEDLPDGEEKSTQNEADPEATLDTGGSGGGPPASGGTGAQTGMGNPAQFLAGCETWLSLGNSPIRASVADSNGTVSAVRASEALGLGLAPPPAEIRLDDFFNHYDSAPVIPSPSGSMQLGFSMALRARAIPGQYDLFVGIRAGTPPRPRSVLTLVVDTTPSMTAMPIARASFAVAALAKALQAGDKVTLLTTDAKQGVKTLDISDTGSQLELESKSLTVSGEADVFSALTQAYAAANAHFDPAANNRVVFVSDGAEPLSALPIPEITSAAEKGIFLVGVGVGPTTSYRERLLDHATYQGRGSTVYVHNAESAETQLHLGYDQVMGIVLDDIRVELELPWYLHRVDEESATGAGEHKPQYLAPGATLSFLFRVQVCNKAAFLKEPASLKATVNARDPKTQQEVLGIDVATQALPLEQVAPAPALDKALAIQSYVEALRSLDLKRVQRAKEAAARAADDPDVADIRNNVAALEQVLMP